MRINFKDRAGITLQTSKHPKFDVLLILSIAPDGSAITEIKDLLHKLNTAVIRELCFLFTVGTDEHLIYFMKRTGQNKLQIAHPELHQWVTTCSINETTLSEWITGLEQLKPDFLLSKNDLAWGSNLDILVQQLT